MEHTPGPWRVGFPDGSGNGTVVNEGAWIIAGEDVPVVSGGTHDGVPVGVRNLDDAKLMAASPDLLEALEECADLLERSDPPKGGWTERTAKAARAAIEAAS